MRECGIMTTARKIVTVFLIAFLFLVLVNVVHSSAREKGSAPQTVVGYIEDVSGSSVKVNGRYWDISGAPLYFKNGAPVTQSLLQKGNAVEIIYEGGKATRVTINNVRPLM